MIILLRDDASSADVRALSDRVRALGLEAVPLDDAKGRAIEVLGTDRSRVLALAREPGVREILTRRVPLEGGEPLWPHFALRLGILFLVLVCALLLLAAFLPPGLADAAGKAATPSTDVEWWLRPPEAVFRLFGGLPRWVGGSLVLLFGFGFLLVPFLDRAGPATARGRLVTNALRAAALLLLAGSAAAIATVVS